MQISYIQTEIRGEELTNYVQHLTVVQRSFNELSVQSNKRLRDLETLLDFIQSTTTELICVNEKEEIETSRDWSSKSHHVAETERYQREVHGIALVPTTWATHTLRYSL